MPGTVVRDALAPDLLDGLTLTGTGTVTGSAYEIGWARLVQFVATSGTVTGTSPTMVIEIQGSETSDFSDDVVTLGTISFGDNDNASYGFTSFVRSRYVRAVATKGGSSPVYTGTTVYVVPPHDRTVRASYPTTEALI